MQFVNWQQVDFQRNGYNLRLIFEEYICFKLLFVVLKREPKLIISSKLLFPFTFCYLSVFPEPRVSVTQIGTMLTIESEYSNNLKEPAWYRSTGQVFKRKFVARVCSVVCRCFHKQSAFGFSTHVKVSLSWTKFSSWGTPPENSALSL